MGLKRKRDRNLFQPGKQSSSPQGSIMGPPSMENLFWCLRNHFEDHLTWNRETIVCVLSYTFSFISYSEHSDFTQRMMNLDQIAECVRVRDEEKREKHILSLSAYRITERSARRITEGNDDDDYTSKQRKLSEMLNSFFPEVVRRFFRVPKLHQLPQSDKHLYPNEIIAGFINFLLQVLFHESNISEGNEQQWALLRKELSFLLALLGDIPFQCTHHDLVGEVTYLLIEFEILGNDAGTLVYNSVFSIRRMKAKKFLKKQKAWLKNVELLNSNIKIYCFKFSKLPMSAISRSNVVDSFFIVHSLIKDIKNLNNHRLNFNHGDAVMEQIETLRGELTLSQSFIRVMQDNEEKEGLIQIRDLTYEAEYLISSTVVGNIYVWYLDLRLPSIIQKIKLACIGLQQKSKLIKAFDGKESFPSTGNTATIAQRILKDQSNDTEILEVSYKQLPCILKPCFLYFAAFPKYSDISKDKLTRLWIAEGFIQNEGNKSIEEIADMHLLDLINRNLVQITKWGFNGAIKKCRIHNLLHEFCLRKANEENFLKFCNNFSLYERCQRLCVSSTDSYYSWRSFGLRCRLYRDLGKQQKSECFETMALLKAVDLPKYYDVSKYPAQLRYLGVGEISNEEMVTNLMNLEFIYLSSNYVPAVVLRTVKLRHLVVEGQAEFEEDFNSNMTETTDLRTLSGVWINDEDILRCFPHLHKLKCFFTDDIMFPDLSFLAELESLAMFFANYDFGAKIFEINFPPSIKKLSLEGTGLPWEEMSTIGRLPNLELLKLEKDAFDGEVWETRDGEFQKLKFLKIKKCESLRLWMSCSQHFPALECLVLDRCTWRETDLFSNSYCGGLVEIPNDFGNIPTLQRIQVNNCRREAYFSALQIQIGNRSIQVDLKDDELETDELVLEFKSVTPDNLTNFCCCMEEFIKTMPILDQIMDETTIIVDGADEDEDETTINDDCGGGGDEEPLIFWNPQTYSIVLSYAMQFCSGLENQALTETITGLRIICQSYINRKEILPGHSRYVDEIKKSKQEFSDMLVKSLIPKMQRFFEVPKTGALTYKDNEHLKRNEMLACFMNFLLQVLFSEVNHDSTEKEQYSLLQKELSFLLAVLGDRPLKPSTHPKFNDQVNNLLMEFEMLANKVGGFFFSCVFPFQQMKISRFRVEVNVLLEMAKLLYAHIEKHCTNFSELPLSVIVRYNVVDSFFIVDSLIEDLRSIFLNGQLGSFSPDDAIKENMKTLRIELTQFKSFIKDLPYNAEKIGLIQIRDLTYEAEFLIKSMVAGSIPIWYLNLRFQSIICKIKLACNGLQHILETKDIRASDHRNVSFPTRGNTATMDDKQFVDFNPGITHGIFTDLVRNSNKSRQVISIFGMPGLGKTTTANKLYNRSLNYFDQRAWCVVSQNYSVRNLLIKILMSVRGSEDESELSKKDVSKLGVQIHQTLLNRKYLIVLDDVWHSSMLEELLTYFPDDKNWSRVLITTRSKNVSQSVNRLHELPTLSEDQCWDLLREKAFPPSHLVSVGKKIAARCSGVPLAVATIAGVLVNLEKEESEWRRVEQGLDRILLDDQSDYKKIMELSYEHLPHNLKPCFLYFATFPEDADIPTKELKLYWMANGFIPKDGKNSQEEVAEMYLLDLMNRSLVMTAKGRYVGGPKTCKIHDLLHGICIKRAHEENLVKSNKAFGLHRRSFRGHIDQSSYFNFRTMALLKIVELLEKYEGLYRNELPRVDLPSQLSYLVMRGKQIPKGMVDNLVNLEMLDVRGGFGVVVVVPIVVLRMAKLRHLFVRQAAKFEEDCDNSDILETKNNLRSISRVVIQSEHDEEILRRSPHLRTLKCIIKGKTIIFPDLSSLAQLQSLRIDYEHGFGGEIPLSKSSFPLTIRKLCLKYSKLGWEKMSIIGELPNLEVLKLELDAFVGEEWETNDDEFQKLRFLKFDCLGLNQWSSESSHFPRLEQLVLWNCENLVEIPSELGYIPSLQRIEMRACSKKACMSAIGIEQEQREYSNQQLQVDITNNIWTKDKWTKEELMREYTESTREEEEENESD